MEIQIQITAKGGVQMLHDDAVDLSVLGNISVERASHIEYNNGRLPDGIGEIGWYVISAKTGALLKSGLKTRSEALAWEKQYYSPSGQGWAELTKEA